MLKSLEQITFITPLALSKHFHIIMQLSYCTSSTDNTVILHWYQQNIAQNQADIKLMVASLTGKILPRTCVWKCLFTYKAKSENTKGSYLNIT